MTDPRFRLTESFIAQVYAAKTGKDLGEAAEACAVFLAISRAMALISAAALEQAELDARAHALRGQTIDGKPIPAPMIAMRIDRSRSVVFEALRRHQARRRAAWKVVA